MGPSERNVMYTVCTLYSAECGFEHNNMHMSHMCSLGYLWRPK